MNVTLDEHVCPPQVVFEHPPFHVIAAAQKKNKHTKLETDQYRKLGADANTDIRESKMTNIDISADITNTDISSVIQYIYTVYCGVLGVAQRPGIYCSSSSNAPGLQQYYIKIMSQRNQLLRARILPTERDVQLLGRFNHCGRGSTPVLKL